MLQTENQANNSNYQFSTGLCGFDANRVRNLPSHWRGAERVCSFINGPGEQAGRARSCCSA